MNCRLLVLMKRRPPAPPLFPYRRSSDLEQAQAEADVLLWDGGNNDLPFYLPDVHIALVDPLRVGHETRYHPGEANLRRADVILINKMDSSTPDQVARLEEPIAHTNPLATVASANAKVAV